MATKINCTKNGKSYYRVTATIGRDSDGKLIRKEFYGTGKADAEGKRDEYLNGLKNGLNVNFNKVILGELMHLWLFEKMRLKVKPTSFERYEGIYRNYIKDSIIYGLKLSDLKSIQLQRFYNELFKNEKSANSISNLNKLLKNFFNYAVDEGYLIKNPCIGNKIVIPSDNEVHDKEVEVFSNDEIAALKKVLEGNRLKCLILLDLGTGLRQGELLALKWKNIDMENMELHVERSLKKVKIIESDGKFKHKTILQTPKSKSSVRIVPIPSTLKSILQGQALQQKKDKLKVGESYVKSDFVFTTESGNTINVKNLFKSYKNLLIKASIPHKKFHALRHTYATNLFEREVPLKTVSKLLGHSDISITANIYTHVMPKEKISAAEKLNDLFI
ncbi:MAG: site-specific recombinase, phage integrase family [Clostridiaceae bacterium]|nr:site-specific recombinase, phage integrase family [Clostridiaceae bacterium]